MSYRQDDDRDMHSCRTNESAWHAVTDCTNNTAVFSSVYDAICWLDQGQDPLLDAPPTSRGDATALTLPPELAAGTNIQLLTTGSIHLIGAVFRALGPEIAPLYSNGVTK